MQIPFIRNGKTQGEALNAEIGFWLPRTPYGNLQLVLMDIALRADAINRLAIAMRDAWEEECYNSGEAPSGTRNSIYIGECLFFQMKRLADVTIHTCYILAYYRNKKEYPPSADKIPDSIGSAIKRVVELKNLGINFVGKHMDILRDLNSAHNKHKHSYANHETLLLIGADEPTINAFDEKEKRIIELGMHVTMEKFGLFYVDSHEWLRTFSQEYLSILR